MVGNSTFNLVVQSSLLNTSNDVARSTTQCRKGLVYNKRTVTKIYLAELHADVGNANIWKKTRSVLLATYLKRKM